MAELRARPEGRKSAYSLGPSVVASLSDTLTPKASPMRRGWNHAEWIQPWSDHLTCIALCQ